MGSHGCSCLFCFDGVCSAWPIFLFPFFLLLGYRDDAILVLTNAKQYIPNESTLYFNLGNMLGQKEKFQVRMFILKIRQVTLLLKPPNRGMDSNFRITAPPTFVNQRHQIPFPQACSSSIQINRRRYMTLPVTKSLSSSMKSSIIFLLKF